MAWLEWFLPNEKNNLGLPDLKDGMNLNLDDLKVSWNLADKLIKILELMKEKNIAQINLNWSQSEYLYVTIEWEYSMAFWGKSETSKDINVLYKFINEIMNSIEWKKYSEKNKLLINDSKNLSEIIVTANLIWNSAHSLWEKIAPTYVENNRYQWGINRIRNNR